MRAPTGSIYLGRYLHQLRAGYGYSLRRVEERARAAGGEIDGSQLARYEKGLTYPSFDKLRVLADVFNVSVQSFADVVDLEAFEPLKPPTGQPKALIARGAVAAKSGDYDRAFAHYDRALELLQKMPANSSRQDMMSGAKLGRACMLWRLGKLALAEHELMDALRSKVNTSLQARAMLNLAILYSQEGVVSISEVIAARAQEIAGSESLDQVSAMGLHVQADAVYKQGRYAESIRLFERAAKLYSQCGEVSEGIKTRLGIGCCCLCLGKIRKGIGFIRACLEDAKTRGNKRLQAAAWSGLGDAFYQLNDRKRAADCFMESSCLVSREHGDLGFHNAFYEWKMALEDDEPTRKLIAFGRLKILRGGLDIRSTEVEAFDEFIKGTGSAVEESAPTVAGILGSVERPEMLLT